MIDSRALTEGAGWGLVLGTVILGLGGRLLMSGIAASLGAPISYDPVGTVQVVGLGAAMGAPAGAVYAVLRSRLPGGLWRRALVFGALHGALWVAVYFLRPAGPVELRAAPRSAWFFGLLLMAFGAALVRVVEYRLGRPGAARSGIWPWTAWSAGLLAVAGLALALVALGGR